MLIGNVGKDPEIRYIAPDEAVATIVLATTNRAYTMKDGTQVPERAEWHTVILWKAWAKYVEQYIHKGDKIFVEGELHNRSFTDRNGLSRSRAEIWAEKIELLQSKNPSSFAASRSSFSVG